MPPYYLAALELLVFRPKKGVAKTCPVTSRSSHGPFFSREGDGRPDGADEPTPGRRPTSANRSVNKDEIPTRFGIRFFNFRSNFCLIYVKYLKVSITKLFHR